MRVAICFSGQVRTWEKCIESHEKLISTIKLKLGADVDVFCHAWDFNTHSAGIYARPTESTFMQPNGMLLPAGELDELFKRLSPQGVLVENETSSIARVNEVLQFGFRHNEYHGNCAVNTEASQFYTIMRSAFLKKQYEFKNNFRYDMCIRLRYDLLFDEHQCKVFNEFDLKVPECNTLYPCHTAPDKSQFPYFRLGDIFWYSDSVTFDRICNFYKWMPVMGMKSFNEGEISTEHNLYMYAKMLKMNIQPILVDPKIYRLSDHVQLLPNAPWLPSGLGSHELI
jgi:hypothetical protein